MGGISLNLSNRYASYPVEGNKEYSARFIAPLFAGQQINIVAISLFPASFVAMIQPILDTQSSSPSFKFIAVKIA
jgi:hypothetical protein